MARSTKPNDPRAQRELHPQRAPLPVRVRPMLATSGDIPANSDEWAYEVKWDGIRAVAFVEGGRIRLHTRNGNDVTRQFPELARLGRALDAHQVVLDGEIVALDDDGRPNFQRLQSRLGLTKDATIRTRAAAVPAHFMAFDLLHLDGRDTRSLPYIERRELLARLLEPGPNWQAPKHHVGDGEALLDAIVAKGMEGVLAKRLTSTYAEGRRTRDWVKIKRQRRQEFVVGGWTEGEGRRAGGIGALLLGYHDDEGRLVFAGNVGTGFSDLMLEDLARHLEPLERATSPFAVNSPGVAPTPGKWQSIRARDRATGRPKATRIHYTTPKLVGEVEFTQFTRDGTVRHPSFQGLRFDKDAKDVVREDR